MTKSIQETSTRRLTRKYFRLRRKLVKVDHRVISSAHNGDELSYDFACYAQQSLRAIKGQMEKEFIRRNVDIGINFK
jgi:hypothetical protein